MEYAIVDIETTGGYASASAITDIAVIIHDGQEVIGRYETLINPGQPIPAYIEALTGINDAMVADSPYFDEIAETIYNLLKDRIFIAHNVNFDYSFLHHYLSLSGYILKTPKLCTVRMSRKIKPGLPSYSLGRLCAALDIPIANRHRAGGDADATAVLFGKLLQWDKDNIIAGMLQRGTREQILPPNLSKEDFEALPPKTGVYYFWDAQRKAVYIGKAINLQKRVAQHFTGNKPGPQRQGFLREIYHISYEICGNELVAFLLEAAEIRKYWPKYNHALKRFAPRYGLFSYTDQKGFLRLAVGRIVHNQSCVHRFTTETEGRNLLHRLVRDFGLCPLRCMLGQCNDTCNCYCQTDPETATNYNPRVEDAIEHIEDYLPSFYLIDKGRSETEKSCICMDKGQFYGMGYIDAHADITCWDDIKTSLTRYPSHHYMEQLLLSYAEKHPAKIFTDKTALPAFIPLTD